MPVRRPAEKAPRPDEKGRNSHDHLGSVSIIHVPDDAKLAEYTETVNANNRLAYSLAGLEKPRPDAVPKPVPERHGEPSHQARHLRHQGEPHLRSGLRRHEGGQRRPEPRDVRRGRDAEPPQAGPTSSRCSTTSTAAASSVPTATSGSTKPTSPTISKRPSAASRAAIPTRAATRSPSRPAASSGTTPSRRKKTFRNYGEFVKVGRPEGLDLDRHVRGVQDRAPGKFKVEAKVNVENRWSRTRIPAIPASSCRSRTSTGRSCSSRS